jgi:hypothetical protein
LRDEGLGAEGGVVAQEGGVSGGCGEEVLDTGAHLAVDGPAHGGEGVESGLGEGIGEGKCIDPREDLSQVNAGG